MDRELLTIFMQSWINYWFDVVDWQITLLEHGCLVRREICRLEKERTT
jgi:hypothetical protein